jgi:hypothetical protein
MPYLVQLPSVEYFHIVTYSVTVCHGLAFERDFEETKTVSGHSSLCKKGGQPPFFPKSSKLTRIESTP